MRIRSEGITWREVDGEVIALHLSTSAYFSTNRSGSHLWRALIEGASEAELKAVLQDRFDLSDATAEADVASFLRLLESHDLLES